MAQHAGRPPRRSDVRLLAFTFLVSLVCFSPLVLGQAANRDPLAAGASSGHGGPARNGTALRKNATVVHTTGARSVAKRTNNLSGLADFGNYTAAQLRALAAPWKLNAPRAAAIGAPQLAGKIAVCISPYTPDVFCKPDEASDTYSGYMLKLFEEIAQHTAWLDSDSWGFRCVEWPELITSISERSNPDCTLALGMSPSLERKYRVSRAINQQGLLILTRIVRRDDRGLFSPFGAFTWQLWILLFGSAIFVGIVLWLFDLLASALSKDADGSRKKKVDEDEEGEGANKAQPLPPDVEAALAKQMGDAQAPAAASATVEGAKDTKPTKSDSGDAKDQNNKPKPSRPPRRWLAALGVKHEDEDKILGRLDENLRNSLLHLSRTSKPPISTTLPSQVVLWAWGLTVMITISLYTGATAAILTTSSLTGGIESRADLVGKAVGTWEDYVDKLNEEGLPTIGYAWDTEADENKMLADLRNGRVSALILDANFVRYVDGRNCDLAAVGQEFLINDVGLGLSTGLAVGLTENLNLAIISVIEDGTMEELYNIHVNNLGGPCSVNRLVTPSKGATIKVSQVAGLWCVLLLAVVAGFLLLGLKWLRRRAAAKELAGRVARSISRTVSRSVLRTAPHARLKSRARTLPRAQQPAQVQPLAGATAATAAAATTAIGADSMSGANRL